MGSLRLSRVNRWAPYAAVFAVALSALSMPALALAVVGALAAPRVAHAQDAGNIDINPFRFAVDSRGYLTVDASQVLGHKELSLGIVTNWGRHLLVFENGDQTFEVTNVVTPTLHGAFGLKLGPAELELAISMPFSIMSGDRNPDDDGGTPTPNDDNKFGLSGQGLGNVGVHLKTRFLKTSKGPKIGLGLILSAFLPTASEKDRFLAEDGLQPAASVILDKEFGKQRNLRFAVNAGIKLHTGTTSWTDTGNGDPGSPATNKTIDSGSAEVPVGVAIAWSIAPQKFDLIGEVFGSLPLGGENVDEVLKGLERAAPFIRGEIGRNVRLRLTPTISFREDKGFDHADRIDRLLKGSDGPTS